MLPVIFANNRAPQPVELTNGKWFHFRFQKEAVWDEETLAELRLVASVKGHIIELPEMTEAQMMNERARWIDPTIPVEPTTPEEFAEEARRDLIRRASADERRAGAPPIIFNGHEFTGPELTAYLEDLKK